VTGQRELPVFACFTTCTNPLTVTTKGRMAVQSSQCVYHNQGLGRPNEWVNIGPDSTVFVSAMAWPQFSIVVVLEGFANLGLFRIEVERLGIEPIEIPGAQSSSGIYGLGQFTLEPAATGGALHGGPQARAMKVRTARTSLRMYRGR